MTPQLPKPGQQWSYRAIGYTTPQRIGKKRQVRLEDNSTLHTDHPAVVLYDDGQRFECLLTFTYTGDDPKDPFKQTGPTVEMVSKLPPLVRDPQASKAL